MPPPVLCRLLDERQLLGAAASHPCVPPPRLRADHLRLSFARPRRRPSPFASNSRRPTDPTIGFLRRGSASAPYAPRLPTTKATPSAPPPRLYVTRRHSQRCSAPPSPPRAGTGMAGCRACEHSITRLRCRTVVPGPQVGHGDPRWHGMARRCAL